MVIAVLFYSKSLTHLQAFSFLRQPAVLQIHQFSLNVVS